MKVAILIILSAYALVATGHSDTSNFVLVKESDGISLYERWYRTGDSGSAREIKATFTLDAQSQEAVQLIRNEERGTAWNKNTKVYKVLQGSDDEWLGYIQYSLPWPASNQDCVLRYTRSDKGDIVQVDFRDADHPSFPVQKKVQRIPSISGRWIFREDGDNLHVEYYVTTTPSKTLPSWLTDPIIRNNLVATLSTFRNILEGRESL